MMSESEHLQATRRARFFNTAGQNHLDLHYTVDPLRRLEGVRNLIDRQSCFVLQAPSQAGKTTAVAALAERLTAEGRYVGALVSCESGRISSGNVGAAEDSLLGAWREQLAVRLPAELQPPPWPVSSAGSRILSALSAWSRACSRPVVIFLDDVDALSGPVLLSILSQLRQGFALRPRAFPAAMALIGMRDVSDYGRSNLGSSSGDVAPFNIKEASVRLHHFTRDEVDELYTQHSGDTGQTFSPEAVDLAFRLTNGQPWLVNALAREATDVLERDRSCPVTREVIDAARERVVACQATHTHLGSLVERLREDRVQRVLEPIVAGAPAPNVSRDDVRYVLDFGLVQWSGEGVLEIANPIYDEVVRSCLQHSHR